MSAPLRRRTFLIGCAGTVLATGAACDRAGGSSDGKVELVYRLWDEQQQVGYTKVFESFTAENPDITVRMELLPYGEYWTKLTTELAARQGPDVFWLTVDAFPDLVGGGVLAPLDEELKAAGIDLASYHPNVVECYSHEGKQYGVPKDLGVVGLLYNADLVEKSGVSVAEDLTWATDGSGSFLDLARALTVDKQGRRADESGFDPKAIEQWGFCSWNHGQTQWMNWAASNGGVVQAEPYGPVSYTSPEVLAGLTFGHDLVFTHHVSPDGTRTNPPSGQATEMFYRGEVAMYPANNALLPYALDEVTFPIGVAAMPAGPQGRTVVINGLAEVVSAATSHPEQAAALVTFLASEKAQRLMGDAGYVIPALEGAGDGYAAYWKAEGVDVQPFLDSAAGATINMPIAAGWTGRLPEIERAANDLYLDARPPADVAAQMEQLANDA